MSQKHIRDISILRQKNTFLCVFNGFRERHDTRFQIVKLHKLRLGFKVNIQPIGIEIQTKFLIIVPAIKLPFGYNCRTY